MNLMSFTQYSIGELFGVLRENPLPDYVELSTMVETLRHGHGEISITASAETTIAEAGTYVKAAGTTTLSPLAHNWSMPANNRLQYDGTADRVVHCASSLSMTAAASNELTQVGIAVNDVVQTASVNRRWIATGSDEGALALHSFFLIAAGDYVELWIANATNTANLTVETMNLFVMDMAL